MDTANLTCYGQDLRDAGVVDSEKACCDLCTYSLDCSAWTWGRGTDQHCWLKTGCSRGTTDKRFISGSVAAGPPIPDHGRNAEPIYNTIDLEATYIETKKIFQRMNLTVQDMVALIAAGHGSGK